MENGIYAARVEGGRVRDAVHIDSETVWLNGLNQKTKARLDDRARAIQENADSKAARAQAMAKREAECNGLIRDCALLAASSAVAHGLFTLGLIQPVVAAAWGTICVAAGFYRAGKVINK